MLNVDVTIVGGGTAGMRAYRAARRHTDRVLLIQDGPFGTTCAREGCMPSKLLISAAEAAHHASEAWRFGADVRREPVVDGAAVMARVRAERDRFVGFVTETVDDWPEAHKLAGRARFLDDHTLQVGDTVVHTRATVLATGSRPRRLPTLDAVRERVVYSGGVFDWTTLPESLAVFGPGVIGLELGQALHRLGVRVRVFGVGGLVGPLSDPALLAEARQIFSQDMALDADADVRSIQMVDDQVEITFVEGGELRTERFAWVLSAIGRVPNYDQIGLENTSVPLDARGRPSINLDTLQLGDAPIFAAGDVTGDRTLLHEASDEGTTAGDNAARFPQLSAVPRRSALAVAFCDPQIVVVGAPFRAMPADVVVGRVSFSDQGRSRVMLQNRGALHVYADRCTGRLLGAEGIGPRAEHWGHLLAWSHQQGLTVDQMLAMPFYHPVIEEGVRTALRDAAAQIGASRRSA